MKELRAPFDSVCKALGFYVSQNPARMKSLNIFDCEIRSANKCEQFSGEHPADIFASLVAGIQCILNRYSDPVSTRIFYLYHIDNSRIRPDKKDVAEAVGVSIKYVNRVIRDLEKELEREFVRRELIEPTPEYYKH